MVALLLHVAWKTAIVLGAAAALTQLMRRRSAAARHLIWSCALFAALIVAAIALSGLAWSLPVLAPLPRVPQVGRPAGESPVHGLRPISHARDPATQDAADHQARVGDDVPGPQPWIAWLVVFWMLGSALSLARLVAAIGHAHRLVRRGEPMTEPEWRDAVQEAMSSVGVGRTVFLRRGEDETVPLTWGFWKAVVLLPSQADSWSAERRRAVLLHELAHVKRRDCLVRVCARIAGALHWVNPLVHLAVRRLHAEQEAACDDVVLAAGVNGQAYARHLFEIVRTSQQPAFAWAAPAMGRQSRLEGRMLSILDRTRDRSQPSTKMRVVVIGAVGAGALALGSLRLAAVPDAQAAVRRGHDRSIPSWSHYVEQESRDRVAEALAAGMNDENEAVRAESEQGLAVVRSLPAGRVLVTSPCVGNCVVPNDVAYPWWYVFHVAETFLSAESDPRRQAIKNGGLARVSESGAALLADALTDDDRELRTRAAIILDSVRAPVAVPGWTTLLVDDNPSLRERAAISLGAIGDPRGIDALTSTLLNDGEPVVRRQAVHALRLIAAGGE